jgi:CarD family transcriptional regulator
MYEIGEYVVKSGNGVCRIEDIVHLNMSGVDQNKEYYLLIPIEDRGAKIYVPVDRQREDLRSVISSEEAWNLIHEIPQIESVWIANDKLREKEYKAAIRSGSLIQLVAIIKNMYLRTQKRMEQGKPSTAMDERYFHMAEMVLHSELAFATGRSKEEIPRLIAEAIEAPAVL